VEHKRGEFKHDPDTKGIVVESKGTLHKVKWDGSSSPDGGHTWTDAKNLAIHTPSEPKGGWRWDHAGAQGALDRAKYGDHAPPPDTGNTIEAAWRGGSAAFGVGDRVSFGWTRG
jgi:hypothetical protein